MPSACLKLAWTSTTGVFRAQIFPPVPELHGISAPDSWLPPKILLVNLFQVFTETERIKNLSYPITFAPRILWYTWHAQNSLVTFLAIRAWKLKGRFKRSICWLPIYFQTLGQSVSNWKFWNDRCDSLFCFLGLKSKTSTNFILNLFQ